MRSFSLSQTSDGVKALKLLVQLPRSEEAAAIAKYLLGILRLAQRSGRLQPDDIGRLEDLERGLLTSKRFSDRRLVYESWITSASNGAMLPGDFDVLLDNLADEEAEGALSYSASPRFSCTPRLPPHSSSCEPANCW